MVLYKKITTSFFFYLYNFHKYSLIRAFRRKYIDTIFRRVLISFILLHNDTVDSQIRKVPVSQTSRLIKTKVMNYP